MTFGGSSCLNNAATNARVPRNTPKSLRPGSWTLVQLLCKEGQYIAGGLLISTRISRVVSTASSAQHQCSCLTAVVVVSMMTQLGAAEGKSALLVLQGSRGNREPKSHDQRSLAAKYSTPVNKRPARLEGPWIWFTTMLLFSGI